MATLFAKVAFEKTETVCQIWKYQNLHQFIPLSGKYFFSLLSIYPDNNNLNKNEAMLTQASQLLQSVPFSNRALS